MKISDRDKMLILLVILVAIIALPIFFFIKPKNEDIKSMEANLSSLNERYNYLKDLSAKQPTYEAEIKRLNNEKDKMVSEFSEGILQENTIMFLYNIETTFPMVMKEEEFGGEERTFVTSGYVNAEGENEGDLIAVKSSTTVTYESDYDQAKHLLDYIFNNNNKLTISAMDIKYDRGTFVGSFTLNEFAFIGGDRHVDSVKLPSLDRGNNENIFKRTMPVDEEELEEEEEEVVEEGASENATE